MEDVLRGDQKFEMVRHLGAGAFGDVIPAKNRYTGEEVAIKLLPRGPEHVTRNVLRELLTQSNLCHPHVVRFREVFLTQRHLGVVLEYMAGGDLYKHCSANGCLSETKARRFLQQIIVAVDYMHKMGVVNRDIKLENTLLDKTKQLVKLTDFGFAKGPEDSLPHSNVGTPNYAAPEVIQAKEEKGYNGQLADVWSAGVLLYVMLFNAYPFQRPEDPPDGRAAIKLIADRSIRGDYVIPMRPTVSKECKDFLRQCLQPDPVKRISVEQIYEHPWFAFQFPVSARFLNLHCLHRRAAVSQSENFIAVQTAIKCIVELARQHQGQSRQTPGYDLGTDLDSHVSEALQSKQPVF